MRLKSLKTMGLLLTLAVTLSCLNSFGQTDTTVSNRQPKFYLTAYDGYFIPNRIKTDLIIPKVSWTIPISLMRRFPIGKKIEFGAGISYRLINVRFKDFNYLSQTEIMDSSLIDYRKSWAKVNSRNYYFGIPLILRYIISKTGNIHYFGFSTDVLYATRSNLKVKLFDAGELSEKSKIKISQNYYLIVPRVELAFRFKTGKFSNHAVLYVERTINKVKINYSSPNIQSYTPITTVGIGLHSSPPKTR